MKKMFFLTVFCLIFVFILSTCATVNSQGIYYFVGKSESDLINHFGYDGKKVDSSNSEYDKILLFTNKILKYQMTKTEYIRYKVTRQSEILNLSFYQFSDGCLTYPDSIYYGNHYNIEGLGGYNPRVIHRNDNSSIGPKINNFNNIINRSDAFPNSQRNAVFERSKIGDTYYLYNNSSQQNWISGVSGYTPSEAYTSYICIVWRIDIIAEDRPETERHTIVTYNERLDRSYDMNNNIISVERANEILSYYTKNGFSLIVITEGLSMNAYIKNGKVVKVEENK